MATITTMQNEILDEDAILCAYLRSQTGERQADESRLAKEFNLPIRKIRAALWRVREIGTIEEGVLQLKA
jgi:hypothetical protein